MCGLTWTIYGSVVSCPRACRDPWNISQTIHECTVNVLDYHHHNMILLQTIHQSQKQFPGPLLDVLWMSQTIYVFQGQFPKPIVNVLWMSWTTTTITQSRSRPFLDVLWMCWTLVAITWSYSGPYSGTVLQTIFGCVVNVLNSYCHNMILLQTIYGIRKMQRGSWQMPLNRSIMHIHWVCFSELKIWRHCFDIWW
jgi:hypothetical protein